MEIIAPLLKRAKKHFKKYIAWFGSASKKKKAIVIIAAIVIGGFILMRLFSSKGSDYVFTTVERTTVTETVSETGNIQTLGKTEIFSPTNGIVEKLSIKNGDRVTVGQELFTVRSTATEQERAAASATYLAAKSTLNGAESTAHTLRSAMYTAWETFRNLATNATYENGDDTPNEDNRKATEFQVSQDNWIAAEKKYKDQETAVSQARAGVQSTWLLYQATLDAVVKAQDSGTVSNLSISEGDSVLAPTALKPQSLTPILTIADFSTNAVKISLNETDIAKVKVGQEALIDPDAVRDKVYKGKIVRVDDIGTDEGGVITYNVYISLIDPDDDLRSGMTVDVDITTNKIDGALSVPNGAIKPYKGGRAVQIYNKKTKEAEYIPVKIGIRGEDRTVILDGLSQGQEIIEGSTKVTKSGQGLLF